MPNLSPLRERPAATRMASGDAEPAYAVDSLLARAERARAVEGDLPAGRHWSEAAFHVADRAGDSDALAHAALGLGGFWVDEHRGGADAALLRDRLTYALRRTDPACALGVRLRARLAGAADYANGTHAGVLAVVDEARTLADPSAMVEALHLAHLCLLGPGHGPVRRTLADELFQHSVRTRRRLDGLTATLWRTVDLFLDADAHAERRYRELREALAHEDHRAIGYVADSMDVMLQIRAGRLEAAETLARAGRQRGESAGDRNAGGWHAAQLVTIRWYQGRIAELTPMLAELVHSPELDPVDNSLFAALAMAAASAGDRRAASVALATLCGHDLLNRPRSIGWLAMMYGVVEAAHLLADVDVAARAYELLLPHADLPMIAGLGAACFGSVHHALGVAAITTSDVDRAVGHLRMAIRRNLALGHWPAVVTSRLRYAQTLRMRAGPADLEEAATQWDNAIAEAESVGMPVNRGGSGPTRHRPVTCSRHGRNWRLAWGNRHVSMRHSVGMQHLAVLLNNPGKEIHALDLVAALNAVASASRTVTAQPMLDQTAIRQYRRRIAELTAEIEEYELLHDYENASRLRTEHDWLVEDLSAAAGIGGYIRNFPDGGERARVAVGKAIRRALAHIAAADAELGAHLREAVHTGLRCTYWKV